MKRVNLFTMGFLTVVAIITVLLPACGGSQPTSTITPVQAVAITHAIDIDVFKNCQSCHATGTNGAPKNPDNHTSYKNNDCTLCHKPQ